MRIEQRYVSDDGSVWESESEALMRDMELGLEEQLGEFLADPENVDWTARGQAVRFKQAVRDWERWAAKRAALENE